MRLTHTHSKTEPHTYRQTHKFNHKTPIPWTVKNTHPCTHTRNVRFVASKGMWYLFYRKFMTWCGIKRIFLQNCGILDFLTGLWDWKSPLKAPFPLTTKQHEHGKQCDQSSKAMESIKIWNNHIIWNLSKQGLYTPKIFIVLGYSQWRRTFCANISSKFLFHRRGIFFRLIQKYTM